MTCPRQDAEHPLRMRARWERGRWGLVVRARWWWLRVTGRMEGGIRWPGGPKPRTCSYCGGVHPDDAVSLLKAGWHVEGTDKSYKRYLNPPSGPGPVPPVKVYVQHFGHEQIAAFNAASGLR